MAKNKKTQNEVTPAVSTVKPQPAPAILKLDIGCGTNKKGPDWTGIDAINFPGVDVVLNLTESTGSGSFKPWPWADNSVDEVNCSHFLEHLERDQRIFFVNELYRVMKNGAKAAVITPHWSSARFGGDLTHCFSEDTEILTENGWKLISDCYVGENALTLDLKTECSSYTPILKVIDEPYEGPMLSFKTECLDILATPNHDLIWRSKGKGSRGKRPKLNKSEANSFLKMGGHHPRKGLAVVKWEGESPSKIRIAEDETVNGKFLNAEFDSLAFAEIIGWFVSEGNVDLSSDGHYRINIAQDANVNPAKVEMICDTVKRLGCVPNRKPDRITFSSKPLALFLHKLGLSFEKRLPNIVKNLSPYLLGAIIRTACWGDGNVNGSGRTYSTTSPKLADDVQEIALKAGYRTSMYVESRKGKVNIINGHSATANYDMIRVGIYNPKDIWYPIPMEVPYKGNMVCVGVKDHNNILIRRNGSPIWVGNCWPPVTEYFNYSLDVGWRKINSPHNDFYKCNFSIQWGYAMRPDLLTRNSEYQQFALANFKEACQDMVATWTKVPMPTETP
jgi:hypothetical protein